MNDLNGGWTLPPSLLKEGQFKTLRRSLASASGKEPTRQCRRCRRPCLQCRRPRFDSWVGKIRWRRDRLPTPVVWGFPWGSAGKESACNLGDLGLIPGLGRSPGEGNGYPRQHSGLQSSMDCMGSQRAAHDSATFSFTFMCKIASENLL